MAFKIFKNPNNAPEIKGSELQKPKLPDGELCTVCPACKKSFFHSDLAENCFVCLKCEHHHRPGARARIKMITDKGSFKELFAEFSSKNIIGFPDYGQKLKAAMEASNEKEAVVCGAAQINGIKVAMFVMDSNFMMGSMGTVVGEKITLLFEYALKQKLPVVGFAVSGGARMQEGILSLMQMAKTSAAVKRHSDKGYLYIAVLTDPTTGGVTASFAMQGDIILAEPKALIGFAGPRVIEDTIRQKLPPGFQTAEFLLEKGFVDKIVPRKEQKAVLTTILKLHRRNAG
ncbi:MAG: acetyl-CoA carboxylase, carboxyltransferase subunit beta [Spirochaetes bacterium]|nr:acetyl-CoA carboxylase, carboxyltransferase subunit beta [Spirochaetota bacterium]